MLNEKTLINERIDYKVAEFFLNQNPDGIEKITLKTFYNGLRSVEFRDVNDNVIIVTGDQYRKYSQLWTL
jgi:hypothetical protein